MDLKSRVERQLNKVREVTETFLSAFGTPEQWTLQVHDKANPPLWVAGHLGTVDNFMISLLAPEKAVAKAEYQAKFGMGSRPTSDPADYPPPEEVLAFMRERRRTVLEILAGLSDDDMSKPTPGGHSRHNARRGLDLRAGRLARGHPRRPGHRRPPSPGPCTTGRRPPEIGRRGLVDRRL